MLDRLLSGLYTGLAVSRNRITGSASQHMMIKGNTQRKTNSRTESNTRRRVIETNSPRAMWLCRVEETKNAFPDGILVGWLTLFVLVIPEVPMLVFHSFATFGSCYPFARVEIHPGLVDKGLVSK